MKNIVLLCLLGGLLVATSSCLTQPPQPYAKTVEMEPGQGGIIMIHPSEDPIAHGKAEVMMQSNCGSKKYQILKEGETKVGTSSSGSTTKTVGQPGLLDALEGITGKSEAQSNSATTDITEWRITYKCK